MTLLLLLACGGPSAGVDDSADTGAPSDSDTSADTSADTSGDPCPGNDDDCIDAGDCDDDDASVFPGAPDACDDGIDQDCDGLDPRCALAGELLSTDAELTFTGTPLDGAGGWVGSGDVNGDDATDVLIAASGGASPYTAARGALFAFEGPFATGAVAVAAAGIQITGEEEASGLGYVASLGASQLAISGAAGAFVFDLPLAPGATTEGSANASIRFEYWVESILLADATGDGVDDLLVGTPDDSDEVLGAWVGAVYLFSGPSAGERVPSEAVSVLRGEFGYTGGSSYVGHFMGTDIAVGDLDGDGIAEVAVGAAGSSLTSDAGTIYVFANGLPPGVVDLADADATITGESWEQPIGDDLAIAGDMNGDGSTDLVASGEWSRYNGHPPGKVYVFSGPIAGSTAADAFASFSGEAADDGAGELADHAPDLDADGAPDLVVGASGNDGIAVSAGRAYVAYGPVSTGAWALSDADVTVSGATKGARLGQSVDGAGDLDSDGVDDLLLGGPHLSEATAAWLFFGGAR